MTTIAADLEALSAPLERLQLLEGNARRGDVEAIARSLDAFGQRKPVVARRNDGAVIAGNHTLLAARHLGWDRLAVVWVDDDDTTAHAYALADNRTAELGGYDPAALAALIEEVRDADADLMAAISYDDADLDDLLASLEESAEAVIEHSDPHTRYGGGEAEGSFTEPTLEDRYEAYQNKAVRSIVLDYPVDDYERLAARAAELREAWGLASTAELFAELLARAEP